MQQNKFFSQSYNDALNDYIYSCSNDKSSRWDWIVLTAANEKQAESYRIQIKLREEQKRLPINTKFIVVTDYNEQRIGSGGATLNVIRVLVDEIGIKDLLKRKILVINSGGDSKRIPQYSACGKLFAPVPRILPNGKISSLFDELLIASTDIPNRCSSGMMIFPSDTELLFNSLQIDLLSCDAAGLSMKAPVHVGQDHGVFVQGTRCSDHRNPDVSLFLHKQSASVLKEYKAVDASNCVDVDTGCIWFSSRLINELYGLISVNDTFDKASFDKFVNPKVCLNFYADFVYPLAHNSTMEEFFNESPENGFSEELKECRRIIFERIHKYKLSLVKLVPARYIHFGMTNEMQELFVNDISKYAFLGWQRLLSTNATSGTVLNSFVSTDSYVPDNAYIENSVVDNCKLGENCILSNVEIKALCIPDNIVLNGLKLKNGKYVCRIYGRCDNPKGSSNAPFLNHSLDKLLMNSEVSPEVIWNKTTSSIWNAQIYPECDSMHEAVSSALQLYEIINGTATKDLVENWKKTVRHSLNSSFNEADVLALLKAQKDISDKVKIDLFVKSLSKGKDMLLCIDALNAEKYNVVEYIDRLQHISMCSVFPLNMRLNLACAELCKKYGIDDSVHSYNTYEDLAYKVAHDLILEETFKRFNCDYSSLSIKKNYVTVDLPVRVNFCGSPSDAAPYCLEHGGTMLDGALKLRGKLPINVTVRRIPEKEIRFESLDQGCRDTFYQLTDIINCSNPFDPYALHKAVIVASSIIPLDNSSLTMESFCEHIGGGIEFITSVNVPKGSGLGTSSILAAAAIKALNELFGLDVSDDKIYAQVFLVEQLMTTGGGWQDQVGGLTRGIKYFTSKPGVYQDINVDILDLSKETIKELNDRFVLIFSGQRRLARNVLREEMNQSIRNNQKSLESISQIQEYCAVMRYYLLKGDITSFAKLISAQFELVKLLDKGASNTCIDYIFDVCEDLIDGKSICGAGGGGFLQVILKEGVSKEDIKKRIQENFLDCGVEVWDSEFY